MDIGLVEPHKQSLVSVYRFIFVPLVLSKQTVFLFQLILGRVTLRY